MNPWYKSRKLWTLVADFVFAFLTLLVSIQWPEYAPVVVQLFALLQPLVIALIALFTFDDMFKAWLAFKARQLNK